MVHAAAWGGRGNRAQANDRQAQRMRGSARLGCAARGARGVGLAAVRRARRGHHRGVEGARRAPQREADPLTGQAVRGHHQRSARRSSSICRSTVGSLAAGHWARGSRAEFPLEPDRALAPRRHRRDAGRHRQGRAREEVVAGVRTGHTRRHPVVDGLVASGDPEGPWGDRYRRGGPRWRGDRLRAGR